MQAQDFTKNLSVGGKNFTIFALNHIENYFGKSPKRLPFTLKILLENLLRNFDKGENVEADIQTILSRVDGANETKEIAFSPTRVLMQDFTGVPAIVDLAAMRDAVAKLGGNPDAINPLAPVDLVIDHSVMVDKYASITALEENTEIEMKRNQERYEFLKWGQGAFEDFSVVPPGTGICHQVNLEFLAKVVWVKKQEGQNGQMLAFPDSLVGTDSHTTMINGLSVLGWGVGGIEAEAAMLGQPISMLIPEVIGFKLVGNLQEGITATDLVLKIVQMLRQKGVVGKFVEFYGDGLKNLPLADRATIANMAPEYGATCGFFPIDEEVLNYLSLSHRNADEIALVEAYAKEQGLWLERGAGKNSEEEGAVYTDKLELDISKIEANIAGPKRPQDRIYLKDAASEFNKLLASNN